MTLMKFADLTVAVLGGRGARLASPRRDFASAGGILRVSLDFLPLRAVLRTATLVAPVDARVVERAAHDVVTNAREILDAAAAHQHHRVLLQVVALAAGCTP